MTIFLSLAAHHRVRQRADALNGDVDPVARVDRRHSGGRTREDDVARQKRERLGRGNHQFPHPNNHR